MSCPPPPDQSPPALSVYFDQLRQRTLNFCHQVSNLEFSQQAHPDFSPIGWHLGHIGWTEGLWLLPTKVRKSLTPAWYNRFFAADGLPKQERSQLPSLDEILAYLNQVRQAVVENLESSGWQGGAQEWLGWWLLQHEAQHYETMQIVLNLQAPHSSPPNIYSDKTMTPMVKIPAGDLKPPSMSLLLLDNEKPRTIKPLPAFEIDQHPVSRGQFQYFIESGGYQQEQWWTKDGWAWLQTQKNPCPRYWHWDVPNEAPVCGLSWYEAAAYARFVGKNLPTEDQWERAIQYLASEAAQGINFNSRLQHSNQPDQNPYQFFQVWEWTETWFSPYPGFCSSPYPGYSAIYFDQAHRVLKGGSLASHPITCRPSFRNWYAPQTQEIFAGVRCVKN